MGLGILSYMHVRLKVSYDFELRCWGVGFRVSDFPCGGWAVQELGFRDLEFMIQGWVPDITRVLV